MVSLVKRYRIKGHRLKINRYVPHNEDIFHSINPNDVHYIKEGSCTEYQKLSFLYDKIKHKKRNRSNGRYMIKNLNLKHFGLSSYQMKVFKKSYFCDATSGIRHTTNRKDNDIFYSNNFKEVFQLAKYLSQFYKGNLIAIVDRKNNGNEIYLLSKHWTVRDKKIIVNP